MVVAWVLGLGAGVFFNIPSDNFVWWFGLAFGLALYPALFPLGLVFPRLTVSFASGAMVGGGFAFVISVFTTEWAYVPGSLTTLVIGFFCVSGQWARLDLWRSLHQ